METFFSYIERVLYSKDKGYYMQKRHPAGVDGDYITSSSHPIFISSIYQFIKKNFKDFNLTFVDFGAGTGEFIISLKKMVNNKKTKFIAIEKIKRFEDEEIKFLNSIEELEKVDGIIFSFELFDSLPFHLIEKKKGEIKEIYVNKNKLIYGDLSNSEILDYIKRFKINLKEGQRIELPLLAEKIYEKMSEKINSGFLITFDYGFKASVLYNKNYFKKGTLMTHKNKKMGRDPLDKPYKKDITYAVNFSALEEAGKNNSLLTVEFTTLSKFIVDNISEDLKNLKDSKHPIPIYDLIFGIVGQDIKVLIQKKK